MLERTRALLDSYYRGDPQQGLDGQWHALDPKTRISAEQGELLAALHVKLRPAVSIEVGMAYGYSTFFIADVMHEHGYGQHFVIDPFQRGHWRGIALAAIDKLDFAKRVRHVNDYSLPALVRMQEQGVRAGYVFIDGMHTFDGAFVDFMCADRLLDVGGIIVLDDMWMPSIRKVAAFIRRNLGHYQVLETPVANVFCVMKKTEDTRAWDHFVDFGGTT
jgi:predicted O-methyltransferase YrrM